MPVSVESATQSASKYLFWAHGGHKVIALPCAVGRDARTRHDKNSYVQKSVLTPACVHFMHKYLMDRQKQRTVTAGTQCVQPALPGTTSSRLGRCATKLNRLVTHD
jgi:hypothetical protein